MSQKQREAEKAYTLAQAAEIKEVSVDTLKRAIKATEGNTLEAFLVGRGYRVLAGELDRWFKNNPRA